jgi:tRNA modification GTPase
MTSAIDSLKNGKSEEFIAVDLRSAIESIGEIIGLVTTEEILNSIFSKFCIGK